jgi:hypothetical protein
MDVWQAVKDGPALQGSSGLWLTVIIAAVDGLLHGDETARRFLFDESNEVFTLAAGSIGMEADYLRKMIKDLYRKQKGE